MEYELPGLTQIQVRREQGMTFASALRATLRQDPDVIFVGEIRQAPTISGLRSNCWRGERTTI